MKDEIGGTPIAYALCAGHEEIVDQFIGVTVADSVDKTPIWLAALNGHGGIVQLLVEKRAAVNVKREFGFTPLFCATLDGHRDIVKWLAEKGADVKVVHDAAILCRVVDRGHEAMVKLLLESRADVHVHPESGSTPLINNRHVKQHFI